MLGKNITSLLLRGLTLSSKFILIVFVARYLTTDKLGVYGLFTATSAYALYFFGLDYYTYSTREMLSSGQDECPKFIRDQAVFTAVVYLLGFPLLLGGYYFGIIEISSIGWFCAILITEHLNQEGYRILIAVHQPLWANSVFFIRNGAWVYVVLSLMVFHPTLRTLNTIWAGWFAGGSISLFLTVYALRHLKWAGVNRIKVNWPWILRGVKVALPFFMGTLALRGIFTFDRYFLKFYWNDSEVGIYTFYMGIANALNAFIDAGVTVHYYPNMVKNYREGNYQEYNQQKHKMLKGILITTAAVILIISISIKPLLIYIGKNAYRDNLLVLWLLLAGMSFMNLSMVPHYSLYAKGKDRGILLATVVVFVVCMILYAILIPLFATSGAALAFVITTATILIIKLGIDRLSLDATKEQAL